MLLLLPVETKKKKQKWKKKAAKPKVHGLITSSGNQLYLNLFQQHSPTSVVRVEANITQKFILPSWSPASLPPPNPSSASEWSLWFFSLISLVQTFSHYHHFHSFRIAHSDSSVCDFRYYTLNSCDQFSPCFADFSVPAPMLLIPLLAAALLFLVLSSVIQSSNLHEGESQCRLSSSRFSLPCSDTAGPLIRKSVLRKDGLLPYREQARHRHGTPTSSSRLGSFSSFPHSYQCNNVVRWEKTHRRLSLVFRPCWRD